MDSTQGIHGSRGSTVGTGLFLLSLLPSPGFPLFFVMVMGFAVAASMLSALVSMDLSVVADFGEGKSTPSKATIIRDGSMAISINKLVPCQGFPLSNESANTKVEWRSGLQVAIWQIGGLAGRRLGNRVSGGMGLCRCYGSDRLIR